MLNFIGYLTVRFGLSDYIMFVIEQDKSDSLDLKQPINTGIKKKKKNMSG